MMAATLVANSNNAPTASRGAPDSRVNPTTASGGTSEIAIATPGTVSESPTQRIWPELPPFAAGHVWTASRSRYRMAQRGLSGQPVEARALERPNELHDLCGHSFRALCPVYHQGGRPQLFGECRVVLAHLV